MPLQLGMSQQQYGQARVADTTQLEAAKQEQKLAAIKEFTGAVASGVGGFIKGATNRVNVQGMQDAISGNKNEYIQDNKLLADLYNQSYNQTQAQTKVADFQNSIPSLYEQGMANGTAPEEVQKQLLQRAQQLDAEMEGLDLDDDFKAKLSESVSAGYRSIYKIGSEIQAGQAVSNAQAGLNTSIGATTQSMQYSLEAGDSGGARAQLDSAIAQIDASQWLKPEQKQQQKQQLFLQAASIAQSPHAVQWLQEQAEQVDPANVALRPKFKDLQAQAGGQVRADAINAEAAFQMNPSSETAAAYRTSIDSALAAGALTPEQAAQQQASLAGKMQTVQRQEMFQSLLTTSDISVRTAAVQSGLDPDDMLKKVTERIVDVPTGISMMQQAGINHDPDLYQAAAKQTAKLINPVLGVLSTFKQGDDVTSEIQTALTQLQALPQNLRNSVTSELPSETQALLSAMQDHGGISVQNLAAAQMQIEGSKKLAALPGTSKEKKAAIAESTSNLNERLFMDSAVIKDKGNVGRIEEVVAQEMQNLTAEQWTASGSKAAEIAAKRRVLTVSVQEPGISMNRAVAVTSSRGTSISEVASTLGVGAHIQNFTAGEVQRLKAAFPNKDFGRIEYQADGSLTVAVSDPDTGIIESMQISAQDMRDRVAVFQKDTEAAEQNFYYRNAAVKPLYANGQKSPVLVAGNTVSAAGIKVPAAQVTNTAIAVMKHEGYSQKAYQDGPNARTEGFGMSTAGGHSVDQNLTEQQNADKALKAIETQYMPTALKAISAAGIDYPEETVVMLATDMAYQGFTGTDKVLAAINKGDKASAIAALKATKAYKLAGDDRNKQRLAWIEASINNLQGHRNAQRIQADVTKQSKY